MSGQTVEELLENLIYDAVVEYQEELEEDPEWRKVFDEFDMIAKELKAGLCLNVSERKIEELFRKLMDKHVHLMYLGQVSAYKRGFYDGARLILKILSNDIAKI